MKPWELLKSSKFVNDKPKSSFEQEVSKIIYNTQRDIGQGSVEVHQKDQDLQKAEQDSIEKNMTVSVIENAAKSTIGEKSLDSIKNYFSEEPQKTHFQNDQENGKNKEKASKTGAKGMKPKRQIS